MIHYVFDLDGTLIDSKEAVIRAYESVGVKRAAVEAHWGRPWQEWCSPAQHSLKNHLYLRWVQSGYIPTLPAFDIMMSLPLAFILTSASREVVHAFKEYHKLTHVDVLGCSVDDARRERLLHSVCDEDDVVYVDDDIRRKERCERAGVRFVWYCGQTYDDLWTEVMSGHDHTGSW